MIKIVWHKLFTNICFRFIYSLMYVIPSISPKKHENLLSREHSEIEHKYGLLHSYIQGVSVK